MIASEQSDKVLLDVLIKYILPIFSKDNKKGKKKQSKLEELVKDDKANLKPLELIFIEDMVNEFLKRKDIKVSKKIEKEDVSEFMNNEEIKREGNEVITGYSIVAERKKEEKDNFVYSVSIKYEENEDEERRSVKVTIDKDALEGKQLTKNKNLKDVDDNKEYSFTIAREKESKTKENYSISLFYESNYEEERLSINYKSTIGAYLNNRQEALHDFTDRVPGKHLNTFPSSGNAGLFGFTYLGDVRVWRGDDLSGDFAKMVDVHECIHTPDEYETRILTSWIMSKEKNDRTKNMPIR